MRTGFIQTLESSGIKTLRFPGLESPGKKSISPGKPQKSPGILK